MSFELFEDITRVIYCCGCQASVNARLTDGSEIYPSRADLAELPFWKCDACGNNVGCHHKTAQPTTPLGCIPTPELKRARQHIHKILDPLWREGQLSRREVYAKIAAKMGVEEYHTGEIRTVEEAREVYAVIAKLAKKIRNRGFHGAAS